VANYCFFDTSTSYETSYLAHTVLTIQNGCDAIISSSTATIMSLQYGDLGADRLEQMSPKI
jgi:hypothetical protein